METFPWFLSIIHDIHTYFIEHIPTCGFLKWSYNIIMLDLTDLKVNYRKIPIISPGLIFVQKAVLLSLFSGELIFGGAYYWKEFCISKWVGLDNKTASTNSLRGYNWEGLLSKGFLRLRFGGLIFRRAYFGGGLLSEYYGMYNTNLINLIKTKKLWLFQELA